MAKTTDQLLRSEISGLAEILRRPVERWVERLGERGFRLPAVAGREPAICRDLVRVVASSEFAAAALLRNWEWFSEALESGRHADWPDHPAWCDVAPAEAAAAADPDTAKAALRQLRHRGLLQILWRSCDFRYDLWTSLKSLTMLADVLVDAAMRAAETQLEPRFGRAIGRGGQQIPLIVLAMGKLGGGELNFSSDIDLIFIYPEEGETDGPRKLSAHEYFGRLSRRIVSLLDDVTADGFVYRVDTRLRPFGESGPPVVSFAALENYLLQHGRSWSVMHTSRPG